MTVHTIPRDRLATALPTITASHTFVALVPVTGDTSWAAETAWSIASAAATGGRKVMLVDLCLEDPILHRHVGDTLDNGIVDAFEYGMSLNLVIRPYLNRTLGFVPRGAEIGEPARVLENPRWARLAKGIGSEGALLLVYLTPSSLALLTAPCNGILALAPNGFDPETTPIPPLDEVLERGVPLLAVVSNEPMPADDGGEATAVEDVRRPPSPRSRTGWAPASRPRVGRWIAGAVAAVAVAALALSLLRGGEESRPEAAETAEAVTPAPPEPVPERAPPTPEPPQAPPADPFATPRPFVVQVAAYDAAELARARAIRLASADRTVFVTPLALGSMGTWYRVYVGPFVSEREAVDARAGLWTARAVRRNEGIVRRAPFALEVAPEQREAVERAGLVPYVLEDRLLVGAFEFPEQTAVAADALTATGIPFTLVERVGHGQ